MIPVLARKVRALVQAGATLFGPKPACSPSLQDFPECDAEVRKIADEVWGREGLTAPGVHALGAGRVMWGRSPLQALATLGLKPDFETTQGTAQKFVHRTVAEAELYFVSSQKPRAQSVECLFRVIGRQPELWHPDTSVIEPAPMWRIKEGRTAATLELDLAGSVFVVFRQPAAAPADPIRLRSLVRAGQWNFQGRQTGRARHWVDVN